MSPGIELWRVVLLVLIFAGLGGAWWWINRGKINWRNLGKLPDRKIKVLEQQWVSHQLTLYLIETEGTKYMLARTQGHVAWQPLPAEKLLPDEVKKERG